METSNITLEQLRASWPVSASNYLDALQARDLGVTDAVRALQIVNCAKRHLTPQELVDALAVDTVNHCWDRNKRLRIGNGMKLLNSCRHTLVVQPVLTPGQTYVHWDGSKRTHQADTTLLFGGQEEDQVSPASIEAWHRDAHAELANTCLGFLESLEYAHDGRLPRDQRCFSGYSSLRWHWHVNEAGEDNPDLNARVQRFLESPDAVDNWMQSHDDVLSTLFSLRFPRCYEWLPRSRSPLFNAVFYGLKAVTTNILAAYPRRRGRDTQSPDQRRDLEEALYAACFHGNMQCARVLMDDYGVSPNAEYGPFDSVLAAAVAGGSLPMVEFILGRGARVSNEMDSGHPLAIANMYKCDDIIQIIEAAGGPSEKEKYRLWAMKPGEDVLA
jgi:hypothetical protein